jgi:hypothetical protein
MSRPQRLHELPMLEGPLLALDLGSELGWADGLPGDRIPQSGAEVLKEKREGRPVAMGNLLHFLDTRIRARKPALMVREAPLAIAAFKARRKGGLPLSQENLQMAYGLHGVTEAVAERWGIRLETVYPATVRAFFIGQANMGNRPATKSAVVQRCHLLGLMPKTCKNENQADALAIWFWAASHFGHRMADTLFLFQEKAR